MPLREAREVVIDASPEQVMAVMLDLESLPQWSDQHVSATVLDRDDRGRPLRSAQTVRTAGITDDMVIALTHHDDGFGWRLESSTWQRSQDARYTVTADGERTRVRFEVTIDPVMPMPGFLARRAAGGVIRTATDGLRRRVHAVIAQR